MILKPIKIELKTLSEATRKWLIATATPGNTPYTKEHVILVEGSETHKKLQERMKAEGK
jgi:hypothetical protein